MHRPLLAVLVALTATFALAAPAGALTLPEPTTPELIDRAVAQGEISEAKGLQYLAQAVLRPNTIPQRFVSYSPWDGTMPLRRVQLEAPKLPDSPEKRATLAMLRAPQRPTDPSLNCYQDSAGPLPQARESEHFFIEYAADQVFGGGLKIEDYAQALDTAWNREVEEFGYAAPPILEGTPYGKYNVRISPLQPGLYGYVGPNGTYGGTVGDNPATAWTEDDADATCMVLNSDYDLGFEQLSPGGTPRQRLESTAAHEFLHSIQFGYGALDGGEFEPDLHFSEGHATWMEDEVFDGADDNHNFLFPTFEDGMGEHEDGNVYAYWLTWRGILERFGTGSAGPQEDLIQRFWEITSREEAAQLEAFQAAVAPTGLSLPVAYHDYAIAARFLRPCTGGYKLPYCFEEADAYAAVVGERPEPQGEITGIGGTHGTEAEPAEIEDDYALNWIDLPINQLPLDVTLEHEGAKGALRMSVVCDTGSTLKLSDAVVAAAGTTATIRFDPAGCTSRWSAVITNEHQTGANPDASTFTPYVLRANAAVIEQAPPPPPPAPPAPPAPAPPQPRQEVPFAPAPAPVACAAGSRLARAQVAARGSGLTFAIAPRGGATVDVDVFQSSRRNRVVIDRLVARFRDRAGRFTWDGRSNLEGRRVRDGYLYARFRARNASGVDVRRVALRRSNGVWTTRPGFSRAESCAPLAAFRLFRPVFGGARDRALTLSYRLGSAADVTLEVIERGVVVRRFAQGPREPGRTYRLTVGARRFIRGDVTFRLRLVRDGRAETARLVARRL